jgi:hypothetical protein
MKERALRIGRPSPLIGVATEPESFDPGRPAFLILNSGVMHHVGACRLSVKLARAVAGRGLLAVRYDYSGIGDSEPRRGSASFEETSLRECAEVMDYLQKTRGTSRFILYGLCSGADASYNTALQDERVVAFAQIDPYYYETRRFRIERLRRKMAAPGFWKRFIERRVLRRKEPVVEVRQEGSRFDEQYVELPTYTRIFPPREEVARNLGTLVARGVRMYVIFTGSARYNYTGQYRDMFPEVNFGNLLKVTFHPQTNHIITDARSQQTIVEDIANWVLEAAGRASLAATPETPALLRRSG